MKKIFKILIILLGIPLFSVAQKNGTFKDLTAVRDVTFTTIGADPGTNNALTIDAAGNVYQRAITGGAGIVDITYADLLTAISGATLSEGGWYRLTNFQTVHYYTDGTTTIDTAINTGAVEPLILLATSDTTVDSRVYSQAYPNDVLHYDWDSANWVTDISFSNADTMVTGFKGVITYREDKLLNLSTGYDFRAVKFRRWAATAPAWDSGTPYEAGTFVSYLTKIYKSLVADTVNDPTGDRWVEICDSAAYIGWNSTLLENGIPMDAADFTNVYTFGSGCHDIEVGELYDNGTVANVTYTRLNNIVFGENCFAMKFDLYCFWMTYGSECNLMSYGSSCYAMTYGSGCNTMTYGSSCGMMTYGSWCNSFTFAALSIKLNVLDGITGCDLSAVDLTGDYSKTIGKASTGELYLKYETWDTDHMDIIYTLICVP